MMDQEKAFFIYVQNTQIGPFQADEVGDCIRNRWVGRDAYIWADGYESWSLISQSSEFKNYQDFLTSRSELNELLSHQADKAPMTAIDWAALDPRVSLIEEERPSFPAISVPGSVASDPETRTSESIRGAIKAGPIAIFLVVLLIAFGLGGGLYWWLNTDSRWDLIEVSDSQLSHMKKVASRDRPATRTFEWALVKGGDSRDPRLFLAASLPERAQFQMVVAAQPATLVGSLQFKQSFPVTFERGTVVTPSLRRPNGEYLPEGDYEVTLKCSDCIEGREMKLSSTELLRIRTGSASDYEARLRDYHKALNEQARSELLELGEIVQLIREYSAASPRQRKSPVLRDSFSQLGNLLEQMDGADLSQSYFFADQYRNLRRIYLEVLSASEARRPLAESVFQGLLQADQFRHQAEIQLKSKNGYPGVK